MLIKHILSQSYDAYLPDDCISCQQILIEDKLSWIYRAAKVSEVIWLQKQSLAYSVKFCW